MKPAAVRTLYCTAALSERVACGVGHVVSSSERFESLLSRSTRFISQCMEGKTDVPSALLVNPSEIQSTSKWKKNPHAALKGVVAGALTGAIEMSINFPTDYVKTQLQLDERSVKRRYNGAWDVVRKTIQTHGVKGVYRGLNIAIWNPKVAVRFGAFEQLKKMLADDKGKLSSTSLLICGLGAGIAEAVLATTPIESIKVKFIHDQNSAVRRYHGLLSGIRQIVIDNGLRGIYRGVLPTVIKSSTSQGTRFFVVGMLKDWRTAQTGKPVSKPMTAVFGAIAGGVSVFVNCPADVVKSRMQGMDGAKYKGTLDCAYQIWTKEGPAALYKGTMPRLVRVPLEVAIVFTVYDVISEFLDGLSTAVT